MTWAETDDDQLTKDDAGSLGQGQVPDRRRSAPPKEDEGGQGELLELAADDPLKCVKRQVEYWEAQDPAIRQLKPYWDANRFWYRGYRGVRLRPISRELYNSVELWIAPGAFDQPAVMNRIPELVERLASHMFQDPPIPECEPTVDTPKNNEACEFSERVITDAGSEGRRNDSLTYRAAFAKSSLYASMFTYQYPDPRGGKLAPKVVEAHPDAPDGTPVEAAHLGPGGTPYGGPFVVRYATPEGTITQSPSEAEQVFGPTICRETLTSLSVRPLPDSAKNIHDAKGVMILSLTTVGQLKERFSDVMAQLTNEEWTDIIAWRPEAAKWIAPYAIRKSKAWQSPLRNSDGQPENDAIVVQLGTYYTSHPAYPEGAYVLSAGKSVLLHAGPWVGEYEGPDGKPVREMLELPVSQMRQLIDIDNETFYGQGIVSQLGPISEVAGAIILGWLDHMDRFLHPIQWVPLGSNVQLADLAARDGAPQYYNAKGQPITEEIPPFLPDGIQFFGMATQMQDAIVGIYENAAGNSRAGDSGKKVALDINQSYVNLSQMRQNTADFVERDWRIFLQLTRCFTPATQRMQYVGPDGEYKEKAWRGSSLDGVGPIKIAMGSFTQRSYEQKQMLVDAAVQRGYMDPFEADRVMQSSVRASIAKDDNPFWLKVNREVSRWEDGKPADWPQQVAAYQQAFAAYQQQAQLAQQQGQQQPPEPPPYPGPFQPNPTDLIPAVALKRFHVLARLMATTAFIEEKDATWRYCVQQAYQQAQQASGQMTVAEQQQAQQTAANQQTQREIAVKTAGQQQNVEKERIDTQQARDKAQAEITKARLDVVGKIVDVSGRTGIPPEQLEAGTVGAGSPASPAGPM